ncbi:hypothetical protein ACH5RR_016248 [Cinchona calisaya]|uniref:DYW domain-containing protein n=1 Tax=Cinchona calisaya TaxID=153742 RepID=A0ABD2ZWD5_9GENT
MCAQCGSLRRAGCLMKCLKGIWYLGLFRLLGSRRMIELKRRWQEREVWLQCHSEKLALAFALLNTPPQSTIRIKKNTVVIAIQRSNCVTAGEQRH